ncbi:MAG: hypothetical protein JJ850_09345 [Kordiimonadaceae bacterium]|nr:hypothetical protein [Kordiimonadaceae bacterium]MBO6569336.1 hypothetical protein [Kordiimonadaceae bacterium]MBO6964811.1 hypothetical protein [Kordiimonadaceae bacterium]
MTNQVQSPESAVVDYIKYRFWLSFMAIIMFAVFGFLALGSFAAGSGLSANLHSENPEPTIFLYNTVGAILLTMMPVRLFLAWKLRPGGK